MNVGSRIRAVGVAVVSVGLAIGLFVMVWVGSLLDGAGEWRPLPEFALLLGLLCMAALCLKLALSIDNTRRKVQWDPNLDLKLEDRADGGLGR